MQEYIDSNTERIGSFKRALYNLDCHQIAGVAINISLSVALLNRLQSIYWTTADWDLYSVGS